MKQIFVSDDGREFGSQAECVRYEKTLGKRESIERWAYTRFGDSRGVVTRATNTILSWEADRDEVEAGIFPFADVPTTKAETEHQEAAPQMKAVG